MTLFEAAADIGGQLNLARRVPGKEEFDGLVAWYRTMLGASRVQLRLGTRAGAAALDSYDEVIVATGVTPRDPGIPGQDRRHVASYIRRAHGGASRRGRAWRSSGRAE